MPDLLVRDWRAITFVLVLASCADEPELVPSAAVEVFTEDVEAPSRDSRLGWSIGEEPDLSIGVAEGDDAYQLFRVRDAAMLHERHVAIANSGTGEIRLFDSLGVHVVTMGGQGEGPGEYRRLTDVARWAGDSIIGWDARQLRISVFDANGNHGRTFVVYEFNDTFGPEFLGITADQRVLVRSGFPRRDDAPYRGMFRPEHRYALIDGVGRPSADLGTHPGEEGYLVSAGGMETFAEHPHGKSTVAAAWQDQVLISPNDRYELRLFDFDGRPTRVLRVGHEGPRPSRANMEAWFDEFTADDTPEERADFRRTFDALPLLDATPAFTAVVVDRLDHLWVRDFSLPGDDRVTWLVFDPDGQVLGRIETPQALDVYEIGADYLLGRNRDGLNVEYVQLWSLRR